MKGWINNATRRAKEGLMQAIGSFQTSDDTDFSLRTSAFFEKIHELNKIKESMELWIDTLDAFSASTVHFGECMQKYYEVDKAHYANLSSRRNSREAIAKPSSFGDISVAFAQISTDINTLLLPVVRDMYVTNCLRPIMSMLALAPRVSELSQERRNIRVDVDIYTAKLQKEINQGKDVSSQGIAKIVTKLDEANRDLALCHAKIYDLLDVFDTTVPFIVDDQLSVSMASLYHFHGSTAFLFNNLLSKVPNSDSTLMSLQLAQNIAVDAFPSNRIIETTLENIKPPESIRVSPSRRPSSVAEIVEMLREPEKQSPPPAISASSSSSTLTDLTSQSEVAPKRDLSPIKTELAKIFGEAQPTPKGASVGSVSPRKLSSQSTPPPTPTRRSSMLKKSDAVEIPNPVVTHSFLVSSGFNNLDSPSHNRKHGSAPVHASDHTNISPAAERAVHSVMERRSSLSALEKTSFSKAEQLEPSDHTTAPQRRASAFAHNRHSHEDIDNDLDEYSEGNPNSWRLAEASLSSSSLSSLADPPPKPARTTSKNPGEGP